jgi:hypothetical protein
MLQLTPQTRIFLATEPVDFRKGMDGLAAVCRQARLSQGRFQWWPSGADAACPLSARELAMVLWNGNGRLFGRKGTVSLMTP